MFAPVMTTRATMGLRTIRPMVNSRERVALLRGLQAYWKMEEADSAVRLDATGNDYDLSQTNGVTQEIGKIGFGAGFVAASNQKLSQNNSALKTQAFTDAFWMKRGRDDSSEVVAGRTNFGTAAEQVWMLQLLTNQQVRLWTWTGTTPTQVLLTSSAN